MNTDNGIDISALFDVRGKKVVVTGGTRGIGLMIARGFVSAGASVIITSRKEDACREAEAALGGVGGGGEVAALAADLATADGVAAFAEFVTDRFDRVDVLVNNAGATWGAPIDEFPRAAFHKILDLNVTSVFELTQALLPALRTGATEADPARVINIGSIDGISVSDTENYSYGAAKAAVHMLTRKLAKSLAREHITVNAIAPGLFPSKMTAFLIEDGEARSALESGIPRGRMGSPEDIAGTAIFLSSRAGAYLTAAVIPVDGGLSGTA